MTTTIEAPEIYSGQQKSLFLGGGITGCPDWQAQMIGFLNDVDVVLLNPRRAIFDGDNAHIAKEQIVWEYEHLRKADAILFWFCAETLCPITLYELGAWAMTTKPLYVGAHRDYQRRFDVETQLALARPDIHVVQSLGGLAAQYLLRVFA